MFCDSRNVLISYYGYAVDDINGFNVVFDGKTSTDSDMSSYLANVSDYSGVESVVYENFLTALTYEWLDCKLADELALEYDVGWSKYGESLVSTFVGVNGRFISVLGTIRGNSGLNFQEFNNMYYLYGSLLEEYVMGLTGYNSTCAVSEVFKGLLNGEEFYYYYDIDQGFSWAKIKATTGDMAFNYGHDKA